MPPLSGLQLDVLHLYRRLLRLSLTKSPSTYASTRAQFRREAATIPRSDFKGVEYRLRRGHKFVKILESDAVSTSTTV